MKNFILRGIPQPLHDDWKHFASRSGSTMRAYILAALIQRISRDKQKIGGKE